MYGTQKNGEKKGKLIFDSTQKPPHGAGTPGTVQGQ